MATITANGPSPIPKLNDILTVALGLPDSGSAQETNEKLEELLSAIREITSR